MATPAQSPDTISSDIESPYAWMRLATAVLLGSIGSVGMWSVVVALPAVQSEFHTARADASLPYTLAMVGFALGGVLIGRLVDRVGIVVPIVISAVTLAAGYCASGLAANLWQFALMHLAIGFGSSVTFAPLIADLSHWFTKRRGIAVTICASGNYLGGTIWPPLVQHFIATDGWRPTQIGIGLVCLVTMLPLALIFRRRIGTTVAETAHAAANVRLIPGFNRNVLQGLLCVAGVGCCVAMSMPQVHIVAYCGDLGYGAARGAEMLSLMLGFGIFSRILSGFVADRIGGLATLLIGSLMQGVALFLYLMFDGLTSLYVISALFGLFQGGIVPMYAIIVREFFPPQEAGARVGLVVMSTIVGMALGGWMSGAIFDYTGSYAQAFANGLLWNLLNVSIVGFLLWRTRSAQRGAYA
jgi:MFS family permease